MAQVVQGGSGSDFHKYPLSHPAGLASSPHLRRMHMTSTFNDNRLPYPLPTPVDAPLDNKAQTGYPDMLSGLLLEVDDNMHPFSSAASTC